MTLDYGNYGIFLIMGNAGFISSTVGASSRPSEPRKKQDPKSSNQAKPSESPRTELLLLHKAQQLRNISTAGGKGLFGLKA